MSYIRTTVDIIAKKWGHHESLVFLVKSGKEFEWVFDRLEQFRDEFFLKGWWPQNNLEMKVGCELVSEEQLQVERLNARFSGKSTGISYVVNKPEKKAFNDGVMHQLQENVKSATDYIISREDTFDR